MKKTLALLLALLMLLSLLLGAALAEDEKYTYSVSIYATGPLGEDTPLIDMMNEKYGVEFELVYIENSVRNTQINLLAMSNEPPDVFLGGDPQSFYEQGVIGTFTEEFFREHMPRTAAMLDAEAPRSLPCVQF